MLLSQEPPPLIKKKEDVFSPIWGIPQKAKQVSNQFSKLKSELKMKKVFPVVLVFLVGCASSGPIPIGQDTFMITKQSTTGFHSGASVKAEIYREANEYCLRVGKQLQPVSTGQIDGVPGRSFASAELSFRCLSQSDSELNRPTLKPVPNVVIENR